MRDRASSWLGSICLRSFAPPRWRSLLPRRILQGIGGAPMVPVGRMVLVRTVDRRELGECDGLADHPGADRPLSPARRSAASSPPTSPGTGSSSSTSRSGCSGSPWSRSISRTSRRRSASRSISSASFWSASAWSASPSASRCCGLSFISYEVIAALLTGGAIFMTAYVFYARRQPSPILDLFAAEAADLPRQCSSAASCSAAALAPCPSSCR